ncbi:MULTISPECIES: saccharopine dehydrogenase NADP-binding domain-containing protein [unclassified Pseudonocardia]|uniref:saccharopine dehydrogenase family protein n=1 Tax=unclassified Pseudonocardia TaxID=2619320 RepID=UPI0002F64FCD|nr:saccharopine dehydrogenase NADP-binding domain-containing protein [Pseudonocardia sp. Ae707_Ps1]OLM19398.1 INTEGRAL MEMBRANE PROTEIN (Rhomboid family) [Pseudonocardia sp. Ae707_Ps1]
MESRVLVYGAYGHTGRFVVAELVRRGLVPVLSGRSKAALDDLGDKFPGSEVRPASVDDPAALDAAVRGVSAVVNVAGPFLDTARPLADAAVRAGAHYLDVAAEQAAVQGLYDAYGAPGAAPDVAVVPAMSFYGGLADLLATAATTGWDTIDAVTVGIGLDRWWPTRGTRITGERNTATRLVVDGGQLVPAPAPAPEREWVFPAPIGTQTVVGVPFSEIVTMARHLPANRIENYLASVALGDVRDPATSAPQAVDEHGRSAQVFVVDVVVRRGREERRIAATGRDIYAVTAPLVVEAVVRLLDGRAQERGVLAPGEAFDAQDFLDSLSAEWLTIDTP